MFKKFALLLPLLFMSACAEPNQDNNAVTDPNQPAAMPVIPEGHETITLGAGCFWCVEAVYKKIDGVTSATSGYIGGHVENPTYADICTKKSGHVEVVYVVFDPKKITTEKVLDLFWQLHDPTQADGQGGDRGPQYLSTIFASSPEQLKIAQESKKKAQEKFSKPIATTLKLAPKFYPAEIGHQDYYELNKNKNPYCRIVIVPKLKKLKLEE